MRIMPTNAFKAFLNFVNIPQTLLSGNSLRDFYSTKCKGERRPSVRREYRRGLELLDALMPYPITDKCNGFADKEAERVDEEIFYYTSESDLKLPDNELVAILSESNPDWFD